MTKHRGFDIPPSVDIQLHPRIRRIVDRLSQSDEHALIIYDAPWAMCAGGMTPEERTAGLRAELRKGMDSGPGVEVPLQFWADLRRQTETAAGTLVTGVPHPSEIRN